MQYQIQNKQETETSDNLNQALQLHKQMLWDDKKTTLKIYDEKTKSFRKMKHEDYYSEPDTSNSLNQAMQIMNAENY